MYAGLRYTPKDAEDLNVWPPGQHNVCFLNGDEDNLNGQVPTEAILEGSAPGVIFDGDNSSEPKHSKVERHHVWTDPNTGITYMPLYVSKKMRNQSRRGRSLGFSAF